MTGQLLAWREPRCTRGCRRGLTLQIGSSTGRSVADNCDIVAKVPELLNSALTNPSSFVATRYQPADSCHKVELWQTQVQGLAAYTIPKIDVLVSSIIRSQPNVLFGVSARGGGAQGNSAGLSALLATPQGQVNLLPPGRSMAIGSIRWTCGSARS